MVNCSTFFTFMTSKLCNKCGLSTSVYYRQYSGEYLCKKCFVLSIESKTSKTISKFSMIKHDDRVAVGVSGGKDSLALLFILKKIFEKKKRTGLVAVTIDEGIHGYRDESLDIVKEFCSKINVENRIFSYGDFFDLTMDQAIISRPSEKISSCSICGTFRRRALDLAAQDVGANVLATAHNLDDHLQSFLINLLSGDIERISWIHPTSIQYGSNSLKKIKPFIEIYEQEIVFYALQLDIPFQTETCPYANESIRSEIREFLNNLERTSSGIKYNLYASSLKVSSRLKSSNHMLKSTCILCNQDSSGDICSVCTNLKILKNH